VHRRDPLPPLPPRPRAPPSHTNAPRFVRGSQVNDDGHLNYLEFCAAFQVRAPRPAPRAPRPARRARRSHHTSLPRDAWRWRARALCSVRSHPRRSDAPRATTSLR